MLLSILRTTTIKEQVNVLDVACNLCCHFLSNLKTSTHPSFDFFFNLRACSSSNLFLPILLLLWMFLAFQKPS